MKARKQVGALCVSSPDGGPLKVLLVTSRDTGRWIIPKGWPMKRMKDHLAAAEEAYEEAGVAGKVARKPWGVFSYMRPDGDEGPQLLDVTVFLLLVDREKKSWPEANERRRAWFTVESAARRVAEPGLRRLIRQVGRLLPPAAEPAREPGRRLRSADGLHG
jgi:8-oxo-dGTP pyrophosphatase MutT (NUDIX family)